jgi:addiction module HigA family antidote
MAIRKSRPLPPLHPGEVLKEVLSGAGLTANALALALRVPANRIGAIVKGRRGITGDTALRFTRYFGTPAQMWMNLQARYDLASAEDAAAAGIKTEVRPRAAA